MKISGKIINGRLHIINLKKMEQEIMDLKQDGLVDLEVVFKDQRSSQLNKYFHHVVVKEFGNALVSVGAVRVMDAVHAKAIIKSMFLTRREFRPDGTQRKYIIDTQMLGTKEMMELIDEIIQFAAEWMNYQIHYPNEKDRSIRIV